MQTRNLAILISLSIALLVNSTVWGQQSLPNPAEDKFKVGDITVDVAVPDSPAFAILNVTPETVIRPTSPRQLALSLLNGADPKGNLQTGLAIDTSPYLLLAGKETSLGEYRNNTSTRLLSRTKVSFATTKGTEDDKSTKVALGLTLTPWDRSDPRLNEAIFDCFSAVFDGSNKKRADIRKELLGLPRDANYSTNKAEILKKYAPIEKAFKDGVAKCRKDILPSLTEAAWGGSAWNIGVAPTWTSEKGGFGDLDWSGVGIWSTFAYGFEDVRALNENAQVLFHVRYRTDERVAVEDQPKTFFDQDTLTLAGQLKVAGPSFKTDFIEQREGGPDLNFSFEFAYIDENRSGRADEQLFRYTVGAEYRVLEDVYAKLSIGSETGRENEDNEGFILGRLKWGFKTPGGGNG